MRRLMLASAALLAATCAEASVRVSPVLVEVHAPASAATLTLKNDDANPIDVQIRIFRWTQFAGEERLERTSEVVVSPPFTTLAPGTDYVVRVVRVAAVPVSAEESYRVVVDEIPDAKPRHNGIRFAFRYSIPVFFATAQRGEPSVAWSARRDGANVVIAAQNAGGRRLRISNLKLVDQRGHTLSRQDGLLGYVLGGAARRWTIKTAARPGDVMRIIADSDQRPVDATVRLGPAR